MVGTTRVAAGVPTGGQFAPESRGHAPIELGTEAEPAVSRREQALALARQRAERMAEMLNGRDGFAEVRVGGSESTVVLASVRLDRLRANHDDVVETRDSGRVSDTPDAPIALRPVDVDDPEQGFELCDGHHRVVPKLSGGLRWIEAVVEPEEDDEPLEGPFYDFAAHVAAHGEVAESGEPSEVGA